MLGRQTPCAPLTQNLRTLCACAWVTKWQLTASRDFLAAIEENQMTFHSAAGGGWLICVNWAGERVIVTENDESSPVRLTGMKAALLFLDACLLHYAARTPEPHAILITPPSPLAVISSALRINRLGPVGCDRPDDGWGGDEGVPGIATGVDDSGIGVEDSVGAVVLAQNLPDILDRVQLR